MRIASLAHVLQDGMSSTVVVLLPVLAQAFGLSYAQVGLLKGVKSLVQALLELGSGWISEQIGEARLIMVGLLASGLGISALAMANGALIVVVCLTILGVGTALHHAPSSALIAGANTRQTRTRALGVYNASGDVGKLAFTGTLSLLAGVGIGWQVTSLGFGAVIFACTGVVLLLARAVPRPDHTEDAASSERRVPGWGITNPRAFAALVTVTSIDTLVQGSVMVFVAFLMLSKGVPLAWATVATVALLAGGVVGKAACGYLSDRLGVYRAFTLTKALAAVGLVTLIFAPVWLGSALLLPLGALSQGSSTITYGFAAGLMHPDRMARGYALLYATGAFAAAAGPFAFGLIADGAGIAWTIALIAVASLLAVPPIFLLRTDDRTPPA